MVSLEFLNALSRFCVNFAGARSAEETVLNFFTVSQLW